VSNSDLTVPSDQSASASGTVLITLCAAQFLMTLDTSVMNVSIATVASDLGTTVTGIQTAITLYTLVMASFMLTGAKVGEIIGRKRAFAIGCVIYGAGSLTTALSPNLGVMVFGWSFLEGVGAVLILPAVVALVASNFPVEGRPRAYGLVASAGAIAVAVGPLVGGLLTTYASWRWVFAGEVVIVGLILVLTRRIQDAVPDHRPKLDILGTVLSALGLGLIVFGVLRSGTWGWVQAKSGGPLWLGLSPVIWLMLAGGILVYLFFIWEHRRIDHGQEPLLDPSILSHARLRAGLFLFSFQFMIQAGLFFTIPLFLSVALGLSAVATGVRLLPISITLLLAAAGIPHYFPRASPRRVVQLGLLLLFAAIVILIALLDINADAGATTVPLLLAGLGIGALASQLGAVTVSAVSVEETPQVGGVQNTATNLGASLGTALAGAVLISALTGSFLHGIEQNPAVPKSVVQSAQVELSAGVPFISDTDLMAALDKAKVPQSAADAIVDANEKARITGLRAALAIMAIASLIALFFTRRLPTVQPSTEVMATGP
jgi:MFS family permease